MKQQHVAFVQRQRDTLCHQCLVTRQIRAQKIERIALFRCDLPAVRAGQDLQATIAAILPAQRQPDRDQVGMGK